MRLNQVAEKPGSHGLDLLADAADALGGQVFHENGIDKLEGRSEHVGHIGAEGLPVHRIVEQP